MSKTGSISTYEREVDLVVEWRIPHWSTLRKDNGTWYSGPEFSFGGERWCLGISPNGSGNLDSSGYVDLLFGKISSSCSIRQSFSVSLKTVKGNKYNEQHGTRNFDDDNDCHPFIRFIPRTELIRKRPELMPVDVLTVVCTMKGSTSAGSETERKHEENSENTSVNASTQTEEDTGRKHKENSENKSVDALTQTEEDSAASLCEDYKKMLLDGHDHNLILKVGDRELRAHRDVLRVRSRVFQSMLDHDMKEKNTGVIDVPDCDPDAMELFLSYVYCGKIEGLDHSNMLGLYYVADKYEMTELKRECSDFIKKSLSLTNICSVIQLALNHSDSELLDCATGYFEDNVLDILQTVEWQSFHKDNFTVGNELFIKSVKKLKNA